MSANDKIARMNTKKSQSRYLSMLFNDINEPKVASSIYDCDTFMELLSNADKSKLKNYKNSLCKNRFCPNCQFVYSMKWSMILDTVLSYLVSQLTATHRNPRYRVLFFTFTVPNSKATIKDAKQTYNNLQKYVHNFLFNPIIKGWSKDKHGRNSNGMCLGAFTDNELTNNYRRIATTPMNFHKHALLVVHGSYKPSSEYYLNADTIRKIWYKSCDNHKYMINFKYIYYTDRNGEIHHDTSDLTQMFNIKHAASEASKYVSKIQDLKTIDKFTKSFKMPKGKGYKYSRPVLQILYVMYHVLKNRNRFHTVGIMRKLIRQCRRDLKNGIQDKFYKYMPKEMQKDTTKYAYLVCAKYFKKYHLDYQKLTDSQKIKLNAKGIETTPLSNHHNMAKDVAIYKHHHKFLQNVGRRAEILHLGTEFNDVDKMIKKARDGHHSHLYYQIKGILNHKYHQPTYQPSNVDCANKVANLKAQIQLLSSSAKNNYRQPFDNSNSKSKSETETLVKSLKSKLSDYEALSKINHKPSLISKF